MGHRAGWVGCGTPLKGNSLWNLLETEEGTLVFLSNVLGYLMENPLKWSGMRENPLGWTWDEGKPHWNEQGCLEWTGIMEKSTGMDWVEEKSTGMDWNDWNGQG